MAIANFKNIVVLTGAGISKESGLDTFRDEDGIWSKVDLEEVATPAAFEKNPQKVDAFYNDRRRNLLDAQVEPNAAHKALALLEREHEGEFTLITQNIDNLHELAGSKNILHMHGELLKARCMDCTAVHPWFTELDRSSTCPACGSKGEMRVHVVWFGELPLALDRLFFAIQKADLFISIGTSGTVYPAAGFVQEAVAVGAHTIELNLEPSEGQSQFAEKRYGQATEIVPAFVAELLGR